jgi:hypothetical protein
MTYFMNTTRNSGIYRLAAASLALSLAACGGSGDDTGTGTNATTSTSDATTGGGTGSTSSPTTGDVTTGTTSTSTSTTDVTTGDATTTTTTTTATTGDGSTGGVGSTGSTGGNVEPSMTFFVSSTGSATADLGGLAGADQRCQDLAEAVGAGDRTWHAYLSVEDDGNGQPIHARDRIGQGPWYNAKLVMLAANLDELHTLDGDHTLFLDENGEMVPGQWPDSPDPNEHDILTGTNKDGTVAVGKTCADWTSDDSMLFAQVGHSDGLGPNGSDAEQYRSWNSVHESGGCNDTAPKGGAGRVYCFAVD